MKNNKGFTLTELLVTIAIMGIITAIAFPAITKLQQENKEEEYKSYEKILVNGAKLYMDDHSDIWKFSKENAMNECRNMRTSALSSYIKEYNKNGITCDGSYIIIQKDIDYNITYTPVVICKKNNGVEVYHTETKESCSYPTDIT